MRINDREADALRPISIQKGFSVHSTSVIFQMGQTIVNCSATVEEKVPSFIVEEGRGWLTAEYSMLPGATQSRARRERSKVGGRTMEIQRLIGRSLRAALHLEHLGSRTIYIDCDVLNADGGTRCASISGGYLALVLALRKLQGKGLLDMEKVLNTPIAAVSVGKVDGETLLDLNYVEDSSAEVDLNVVGTGSNALIEVQGTAEGKPFSADDLSRFVELGQAGIKNIFSAGKEFLASVKG